MFASKKSILLSKAPNQFPSCWFHIPDENDSSDCASIPIYDLEATTVAMNSSMKLCSSVKNVNSEEDEWETKILKYGWSQKHTKLFNQIVKILDYDRLARLANVDNKRYEAVQRRVSIDKSADRMRKALASVSWDTNVVQWIHSLLMEYLPSSYLAAYLDIMQTLKAKLPSLVDKMIFWRPGNVNKELLAPILKRPWQPALNNKYRKLPGNALLVVIPSAAPRLTPSSPRLQKLYTLFTTMAPMLPVQLNLNTVAAQQQSLQSISEQMVSITRSKIQELRAENPDRRLIVIGMSSASALALQVALVEQVSGVVCFGFSYNTVHGVRGQADDRLLDLVTPTLFLVGQNAARSSEEEIEFFREKLTAPTTTCVVGAADDFLRVNKTKRRLEGVTQEMVDNMIVDEISDFATKCLQRPLPPRPKTVVTGNLPRREIDSSTGQARKRKSSAGIDNEGKPSIVKSQKLMRPTSTSDDVLEMAVQSILPDHEDKIPATTIKHTTQKYVSRVVSGSQNNQQRMQFVPNKSQPANKTKFITITGQQKSTKQLVTQIQSRTFSRPSVSNPNSRPATPTSQNQVIINNRLSNATKTSSMQSFSPTKYTIVRSMNNTPSVTLVSDSNNSTDLTGASIFDLPIVFADNDGNIDEDGNISDSGSVISINSDSPPRVTKPVVLNSTTMRTMKTTSTQPTFTITKNKNILIQKPTPGKLIMINGTVIGKAVSANNIVLPKANQPLKMHKFTPGTTKFVKTMPPQQSGKKIEIINQTIIKPAMGITKIPSSSFVNLADGKPISGTRLSLPLASTSATKNQIVIKTNALKPYTGAQIIPSSISGNRQLGNLTVKRLNVVPSATYSKVFKKD